MLLLQESRGRGPKCGRFGEHIRMGMGIKRWLDLCTCRVAVRLYPSASLTLQNSTEQKLLSMR